MCARSSVDIVCGLLESLTNAGVTAGNAFHVSYAVFLPTPKKAETVTSGECMEEWKGITCFLAELICNGVTWYIPERLSCPKSQPQFSDNLHVCHSKHNNICVNRANRSPSMATIGSMNHMNKYSGSLSLLMVTDHLYQQVQSLRCLLHMS